MNSTRYGDLRHVAAHTDGDCHLCHEPVDLLLYGRAGLFGDDTATVDHLTPQSAGGSDELANLRIAHGICNILRGTREVEVARLELAGTIDAPIGTMEKSLLSVGGGAVVALGAGHVFAKPMPDGSRQFNGEAALFAGIAMTLLLRYAL